MKNIFEGVGSVKEEAFTASGPGGSGKDTDNSAVRLRAEITDPRLLARLKELYPKSVTGKGEFLVEAKEERSRRANRENAYLRLDGRLAKARRVPKERVETKPTRTSEEKRLSEKMMKAEKKKWRRKISVNQNINE